MSSASELVNTAGEHLPIREVVEPADHDEVADLIRSCADGATPIYPIGGGTSLAYGLPASREGIGLSLSKLNQVIDYPARDMTITVEAGMTVQAIARLLAAEQQRLPIDPPQASRATLGGVVATNSGGCLRLGLGNVRDQVIGISAIDGRGMAFRGGGRVVKNVAGYDFCKLLTGSLGTLGIITQLTIKLKPQPPAIAMMVCQPRNLESAERLLAALVESHTTQVAIGLLGGPAWQEEPAWQQLPFDNTQLLLAVALEGTNVEVEWMIQQLEREWQALGERSVAVVQDDGARSLLDSMAEFPAGQGELVLKASVVPSRTTKVIATAQQIEGSCSFLAHAGNGIVILRFSEFPKQGLSKTVVSQLRPAATAADGYLTVLANPSGGEMTRQSVWGNCGAPSQLLQDVKQAFDPHNILNPGRFVYD